MEEFVEHLSLVPDGESFQTFSPHSASIRRVLKECIAKCVCGLDVIQFQVTQFHQWLREQSSHLQMSRLCGRSSLRTTLVNC
jgi:hypothetical protein